MRRLPKQGDLLKWNERLYLVCSVNTPTVSENLGSDLSVSWVVWLSMNTGELIEYPLYHYNLDRVEIIGEL